MNDTVITGSHFIFLDNEKLSVDQTFNLKGCKFVEFSQLNNFS